MTKKVGRAFLLKISDGAGGFTPFAGITGKSLSINNERIDVTTPDPASPEGEIWAQTLDGTKSISLSGDGKLVKDTSEARLAAQALSAGATDEFQVVVPNVGTFEGVFAITSLEFGDDGAVTFSISLESSGKPTFTPEA